ncbi:MAG TPA: hypothetical protein VGL81_09585 [Polyangiaceae bacterium]|jgi:hypothetical protein
MRARRLASFVLDLLFAVAPWLSLLGLVVAPTNGGVAGIGLAVGLAGLCGLATLVMLVLQAILFLLRGRTLGMACVGLVAVAGSRLLALLLGATVLVVPIGALALLSSGMNGETQRLLGVAVPLGTLGLELSFALAPGARTLTDRIAGIRWGRALPVGPRSGGAFVVDALVLATLGAPTVLVFDWDDAAGPVVASAVVAGLFLMLEVVVLAATRATVGMRALARTAG